MNLYVITLLCVACICDCVERQMDKSDGQKDVLSMPLLDNSKVPLFAVLDTTEINQNLKVYIQTLMRNMLSTSFKEHLDNIYQELSESNSHFAQNATTSRISDTKVNPINRLVEEMIVYHFQNMSAQITAIEERLKDSTDEMSNKVQNLSLQFQNSMPINEALMKSEEHGNQGTGYYEYLLMFLENYDWKVSKPVAYIISHQNGKINITQGQRSYSLNKGKNIIRLPNSVLTKDGIEQKGVFMKSSVPIFVYGFQDYIHSSEGYVAIPVKKISMKYIVASFTVYKTKNYARSLIGITSVYNNTIVNIKLRLKHGEVSHNSKTYINGQIITAELEQYETLQISHVYDLSGSMVLSSSPVVVVSGNTCNSIKSLYCNHFTEMILPIDQLDNVYVVPVIQSRPRSTVRILSPGNALVSIRAGSKELQTDLATGDFYDFEHNDISFVSSDESILVIMYPHEIGEKRGDSFMMTVVGKNQYKSDYDFIVPDNFNSFISITFEGEQLGGFILDTKEPTALNNSKLTTNGTIYTTVSYSITNGTHKLRHLFGMKFGLWIYGNNIMDGYGFHAGIEFRNT